MIVNGSIFLQKKFSVTFVFHWSMMRLSSYSVVWISFFKPCFSSILPLNMVLIFCSVTLIAKGSPLRFSTENLSWGYPLRCFPEPVLFWNETFKIASLVLWNEWILCLISQCLTSNLCTLGVGKCSRQILHAEFELNSLQSLHSAPGSFSLKLWLTWFPWALCSFHHSKIFITHGSYFLFIFHPHHWESANKWSGDIEINVGFPSIQFIFVLGLGSTNLGSKDCSLKNSNNS